jgi:hypothetical protein
MNWQNSTSARPEVTREAAGAPHTQIWGLFSAILVSMDGLADKPSSVSVAARRANVSSARIMLDPPPPLVLVGVARFRAWASWWTRLLLIHLPLRILVLPFDLVHHDMHHSHAIERAVSRDKEAH